MARRRQRDAEHRLPRACTSPREAVGGDVAGDENAPGFPEPARAQPLSSLRRGLRPICNVAPSYRLAAPCPSLCAVVASIVHSCVRGCVRCFSCGFCRLAGSPKEGKRMETRARRNREAACGAPDGSRQQRYDETAPQVQLNILRRGRSLEEESDGANQHSVPLETTACNASLLKHAVKPQHQATVFAALLAKMMTLIRRGRNTQGRRKRGGSVGKVEERARE
eukprot:1243631-Pleurochrysis_carterae.AAC.5